MCICRSTLPSTGACNTCSNGFTLSPTNGTCTACIGTSTVSAASSQCVECSPLCDQCTSTQTRCTSCPASEYLFVDSLTQTCKPCVNGKLLLAGVCTDCDSNCSECKGAKTTCTSCPLGLLLSTSNSTCTSCGFGYYVTVADGVSVCRPCHSNCQTCYGTARNCTACFSGSYFLSDRTCGPCVPGYFVDNKMC